MIPVSVSTTDGVLVISTSAAHVLLADHVALNQAKALGAVQARALAAALSAGADELEGVTQREA
jgi:hypothetical protein